MDVGQETNCKRHEKYIIYIKQDNCFKFQDQNQCLNNPIKMRYALETMDTQDQC